MATTTNYSWTTPDDTDLVKDGASAIRSLGTAIDSTVFTNAGNAVQKSTIDAKADLLVGTADNTIGRLAVGTNGQVLTADSAETTGLKWATPASGSTFVGCSLYKTAAQTISNVTTTALTWNSEFFDTDAFHDNSTNTSRITIPAGKGGYYLFVARLNINSATADSYVYLYKNGARVYYTIARLPGAASGLTNAAIVSATAGDYFELFYRQESGGNLDVQGGSETGSFFSCSYLGA